MTVVDSRGKRTPPSVRGREFSGPPSGRQRRQAARVDPGAQGPRGARSTEGRRGPSGVGQGEYSRRPGALAIWALALIGGLVGVAIGAANHDATGTAALLAYVIAAPIAAGLVRRGRALRQLVCCLPLAFVLDLAVASALALNQGGTKITVKGALEEVGQILVLHSPWLWAGTLLAVAVGARRGLFRRLAIR